MPNPQLNYPALLRFLRSKPKLQVNPKYPYHMRNVALSLNNESIDTIKLEFGMHNNRIDLQQFIWLMKQATADDAEHNYLIYYELVQLFEEIDIDNSNTIEWSELLQYLSEAAWLNAPSPSDTTHTHDRTILFHAFREQVKYRKHPIKKIVEMQRMGLIGVLTCYNQLSFINIHRTQGEEGKTENEGSQSKGFTIHSIDADKVLSLDYSEEERMFGVLLTNRNLCFIEESEIQKNHGVIRSSGTEVDIKYLPLHRLWCLQNVSSTLQLFPSPKTALIQRKTVFKPHQEPLTGITEISNPLALCTSSLDGLIRLWQHGTSKLIIELNVAKELSWGDDQKGVKGMATHNRGIISCIACWMFTSEIYLWLPSLSLSKPFAGELQGHMGLVLECQFTWCGELVSVDDKRFIRVWNIDRFECLQNFTAQQEGPSLFVLRCKPYFVFYSKLLHFYRMRTNSKIDLQGDKARSLGSHGLQHVEAVSKLISLEFSQYYAFFIIVTPQQIRIVDVNQTNIVAVIKPSKDEQFTHLTMKDSRRFYVSSSRGIIYEHKTEDGQLIRQIYVLSPTEQDEPEMKFVYYHEETHILLTIIERKNFSQILTYDETEGESRLVKEIEFEQTSLIDFKFCSQTNLFFLLSAEPIISIWDYDKLVIINTIELDKLTEPLIRNMAIDSLTNTLLVHGQQKVTLFRYDSSGSIEKIDILDFRLDLQANRTVIVDVSLLKEKVPFNVVDEIKMIIGKDKKQNKQQTKHRKEVGFANSDLPPISDEILPDPETSQEMPVLAVVNNFGDVYYYHLDQIIPRRQKQGRHVLRGKVQRMKQKRTTHLKILPLPQARETDCSQQFFNEDSTFLPRTNKAGNIIDHFYFHTDDNTIFIVNAYGEIKGEWTLSLSKPKIWNIAYNKIEQVLARLEKTEKALQRLYKINSNQFKLQFLMTKYLKIDEISQLQKEEATRQLQARSAYIISKRNIDSKKNLPLSQSKIRHEPTSIKAIVVPRQTKNEQENIFEKKFEEKGRKKPLQQNQELYKRVQKSLSYCKKISKSVPKIQLQPFTIPDNPNHFASQIEQLFISSINDIHPTSFPNSELIPLKNQSKSRKTSVSHLTTPDLKLVKRESPNVNKVRIKSSLSEMSKNFVHTKIELQNFLQRTKGDFGKQIRKKGRTLKLKL